MSFQQNLGRLRPLVIRLTLLVGLCVGGLFWLKSHAEPQFPATINDASPPSVQLTFDAEHKENPAFAPNGRHVVYSQGRGSAYRLVIIDTLTGERSRVSRDKGSFTSPAWSP